jgi:glycosyltransferase involved in cell wall biosynthesis
MHVAHFIQRCPPALGGSEAYFARLAEHLRMCGDDVTTWCSSAVELSEFWSGQSPPTAVGGLFRKYQPSIFLLRRYLLKALSLIPHRTLQCLTSPCNPVCPAMWRDAGRFDGPLDAVHATAFPYSFPIACGLRLARRRGVPFFLTPFLHLGDERTRKQYTAPHLRWLLRQADRIFVQTNLERDAVCDLGVNPDRIVLQGLGVDPREVTAGTRTPCEVPVVGHLANASFEKGTVDLLKAAAILWRRGERFRVLLAGPSMPSFEAFWKLFRFQDRVTRLGAVSDSEKRDFYASIDAFALPSRSDSFGLVLLEAWANAKPNLVYAAGGPGEIVRDGIDGLHARCGEIDDLAEKLAMLVCDSTVGRVERRLCDASPAEHVHANRRGSQSLVPPYRAKLGAAGRRRLPREFDWTDKLEIVRRELQGFKTRSAFFAGESRGIRGTPRRSTSPEARPIPHV